MLAAASEADKPHLQALLDAAVKREQEEEKERKEGLLKNCEAILETVSSLTREQCLEQLKNILSALTDVRKLEDHTNQIAEVFKQMKKLQDDLTDMTSKYRDLTLQIADIRQSQVITPLPLPPGSSAALQTMSASHTLSSTSSNLQVSSSGPAAGTDPAAVSTSSTAGNSVSAAAPSTRPANADPNFTSHYVDRKVVPMPSKYDGKEDVESWISSMRAYFKVLGTSKETQSVILGMNVGPVVRGHLEVQATRDGVSKLELTRKPESGLEATAAPSTSGEPASNDQQSSLEAQTSAVIKVESCNVLYVEPWEESESIDFHYHLEHWAGMKQQRAQGAVKLIFFKLRINHHYLRVLIDCGATTNFMSPHGIRKVGFGMKQVALQIPCRTQVGNKEVVYSTHAVKGVRCTFDKDKTVTHALNFYVLDKCPFDAVLGLGWLQSQCEWTKWKESLFMVKDAQGIERPVLLDEKHEPQKGGKLCMCIDYRGLNRITRKNAYPLPRIDELLDAAGGCKVFSKIDLKSGYHQIEVDPADQHKTAFKTRDGLYKFTVMPFGLTNAPATFQCLMDKILREQIGRFVVVYLDDILIFSKSMEEHRKHLEEVLTILKKSQLHLNLEKSEFGRDSVIYLGHRSSAAGLEPEATKVEVIRNWPQPTNVSELRSFLGLASYYRKFVPRFSIIARPLSRLTSKNVSYSWDDACSQAFQALKEALVSYPVLRIADPKLTFVVTTDASQYGIGAVLQQDDGDGLRPLKFYSKRMPSEKVATSTYMRELYALRMTLDHWKHYLLGRHFKVFSDHETLKWIKQQSTLSPTLLRWFHEIDIFDFELKHKKGCYNRVADALSRHPEHMTCLVKSYDLRTKLKEELVEHTAKDSELSTILERVRADPSSQPDFHEHEGLILPNHEPLRTHFLDLAHGHSGHFGVAKTYANLLRQFDWPGMKRTVEKFVAECQVCQRIKPCRQKPMGLLTPLPIPDGPGESISVNFTDMGKVSKRGYSQVMVIVDRFSKFLNVIPLPSHAPTDLVIRKFQQKYILQFGAPKTIISDRDPRFISAEWKDFTSQQGITLCMTSGRHPEANGLDSSVP
ncbi:hypothetical protein CBR_g38588 [Chara braunii]|uniref:Reverse transcriptase n=1 Tax=Chara braunii TaxID=69332 RepID=A0A388K0C8_CHABU|nr:hypothetical protein CBR_g38588 [Chara braunii]|eukprot:GBG63520.1 hypothetical protein CBR_g38588 [Chara braunii]